MSIGDVKVNQQNSNASGSNSAAVKNTTANRPNTAVPRESADGSRRSLADIAQAKHAVYRRTGMLSLPKEVETYLKSQKIHHRWVANKATRLAEMKTGRGYEFLHESHLPPQLQTMMNGFKRPDGTYCSPAEDLLLMILGQHRADELRDIKDQEAAEQLRSADERIALNKDFVNNSTTKVEVGKIASKVRGREVEVQNDDSNPLENNNE